MGKKKKRTISSNDLLSLGFQVVLDDYIPKEKFYAYALPNLVGTLANPMAFTFVTNSLNAQDMYAVYLIGYGGYANDVNLPITNIETLSTMIPIYIQKSLGNLKY